MADVEHITVAVPNELAASIKGAVADGDYLSPDAIVSEALLDWTAKRAGQHQELAKLKRELQVGLDQLAQGQTGPLMVGQIIQRGREILADRSTST
jgi:antitoxin ParD1/3/4